MGHEVKKFMYIRKCDGCKQIIKDRNYLRLEVNDSAFNLFELCPKCAEPITKILKTKKLIKDEKK